MRGTNDGAYTRYTTDGENWTGWVQISSTLSAVNMEVFDPGDGPRLYQAMRGTSDGVYTRYTTDGENWTSWVQTGSTFSAVNMEVFDPGDGPRLYQAMRGTNDGAYTRHTTDGENWSSWAQTGSTFSAVNVAVFDSGNGSRLYQAMRGTNDGVYTRYTTDGENWSSWMKDRPTLDEVNMAVFDPGNGPRLYQAIRGTDDGVYTRYIPSYLVTQYSEIVSSDGKVRLYAPLRDVYLDTINLGNQNADKPGVPSDKAMVYNYDIRIFSAVGVPVTFTREITAELSIILPSSVKYDSSEVYYFDPDAEIWEKLLTIGKTNGFITVEINHLSQYAVFGELWEEQVYLPLIMR